MNKLKQFILKNKWLSDCIYRILTIKIRYNGFFRLLKRKKNTRDVRRVVFLVQLPALWNKMETIYNKFVEENEFEVILFAIPDYDFSKEQPSFDEMENKAASFLKEKGFECIQANTENGWFDLSLLDAEYIFYPRPYDEYLPALYKSSNVANFAKICYTSYGYHAGDRFFRSTMNPNFFSNVSYFFGEHDFIAKWNVSHSYMSHALKLKKSFNVGYPPLESVLKHSEDKSSYWDKNDGFYKVMWTPRWTVNEEIGKSNFFEYKDDILKYAITQENIKLVFRPHPLAFKNFVNSKLITQEELDIYLENFNGKKYILDQKGEYVSTFWHCDVLIADYSSINIEFFISGKPIIYCDSSFKEGDILERLKEGFYVVKSFEEMKFHLDNLRKGIDPLKEKREQIINELVNIDLMSSASQNIYDILVNNRD